MAEDQDQVTQIEPTEEKDPNYFYLSEPLVTHGDKGKTLNRLLLNPKGALKGKDFFQIVHNFQRKFPNDSSNAFNIYASQNFLGLVIAKLNGITHEDLYQLSYEELPLLFISAAPFQYQGPATKAE